MHPQYEKQLIKLGNTNPELRPAIRKVLAAKPSVTAQDLNTAATRMVDAATELYMAGLGLKSLFDTWEEVPKHLMPAYKSAMTVMSMGGKAKDAAYQNKMTLRNILRRY